MQQQHTEISPLFSLFLHSGHVVKCNLNHAKIIALKKFTVYTPFEARSSLTDKAFELIFLLLFYKLSNIKAVANFPLGGKK